MESKVAEAIEQTISAWAFAHNIDGAARNDLFARLRAAATRSDCEPDADAELLKAVEYVAKRAREVEAAWIRVPEHAEHAVRRLEQAKHELLEHIASRLKPDGELRGALFNLAITAGGLVTATDGREDLRAVRQAVLDNLIAANAALSEKTP